MAGNYRDPLYMSTVSYDPTEFRQALAACSTPGVRTAPSATTGDLAVTATGSMTLNVAAGFAVIAGSYTSNQNNYVGQNTATSTVTIGTAPGTGQSRIDRVIAVVYDDSVGTQAGGSNEWKVIVVPGTAAATGSQVAPTITLKNYLELAQVLVGPNVTQVLAANITDVRVIAEHPAVPGRYVSVAGNQTVTGVKTFSAGLARGSGRGRGYDSIGATRGSTFGLGSQNIVSGTWTTIGWNSIDRNNCDDGLSYNSSTGYFTVDGAYAISGMVSIKAPSGYAAVRIFTGGGSVFYTLTLPASVSPYDYISLPFHAVIDYVGTFCVQVIQQSSGTQNQPANAGANPQRIDIVGLGV